MLIFFLLSRFNMFLDAEIAVPIPLKVWQDPQGDVVLHYSREDCSVYFGCWASAGVPADYLCKLTFEDGWAVRGYCLESFPYEIKEPHHRSCIYEVENSQWLEQVSQQRIKNYPEWKKWDQRAYRHYVVSGHDNYYDIVATNFDERTVAPNEASDLVRLIHEA
jgi:hypothetical protein